MDNLSINQALGIWSELEQAYFGQNGFGGDTAEIYAYRLQQYHPGAVLMKEGTVLGDQARQEQADIAGKSLYNLIRKFRDDRECSIEVDGSDPEILLRKGLVHRCHVKVMREK
jgi:hypothetical protein